MSDESDFDLRPDQWETLKALRTPFARVSAATCFIPADLVALGLVSINGRVPVITEKGRRALIRGSFRLLDGAA